MKARGFHRVMHHPKSKLEFYFLTVCENWLSIDHVHAKAWFLCYLEFPFHSRNICFVFEGKSMKEMRLKPRVVW